VLVAVLGRTNDLLSSHVAHRKGKIGGGRRRQIDIYTHQGKGRETARWSYLPVCIFQNREMNLKSGSGFPSNATLV
jgi:hypothetical protein